MSTRLTIAMPTFNRAALLDRQLAWFARAVAGHEAECELIISDNASTDETPEVINKWLSVFTESGLQVYTNRNTTNLGPIRNIAFCMNRATGKYVWTVGDDDVIEDQTLSFILETVKRESGLALLILNFSSRHCDTGDLNYERCFDVAEDQLATPGRGIIEEALAHPDPTRWGGLVLTTALIYRTAFAEAAINRWSAGLDNLYLQFFITAYAAAHGKTLLTRETFLEMSEGRHFFNGNKEMLFRFKMAELPEVLEKVAELGYSPELCREKIRLQRQKIKSGAIRRRFWQNPIKTFRLLHRHRTSVKKIEKQIRTRTHASASRPAT